MTWIKRFLFHCSASLLAMPAFADLSSYTCKDGRMTLPVHCLQISGLQSYLNSTPTDPMDLQLQKSNKYLLRECLMNVRRKNMWLSEVSRPQCLRADDNAFRLLMTLRQEEVQNFHMRQARQSKPQFLWVQPRCFGPICYKTHSSRVVIPGVR